MTDIEQTVLGKKRDLKLYYELAKEAFEAKDVSQAIRISENGLKKAQLENNTDWIDKFISFHTELNQLYSESSIEQKVHVSKKGDLTSVKGVGPSMAVKLNQAGIRSVEDLINSNSERLSRIKGIGLSIAQKLIESARSLSRQPKLNTFSVATTLQEDLHQNNITLPKYTDPKLQNAQLEPQIEVNSSNDNQEHEIASAPPILSEKLDDEEIEDNNDIETEFQDATDSLNSKSKRSVKCFEDKFKRPKNNQWYPPSKKRNNDISSQNTTPKNDEIASFIEDNAIVQGNSIMEESKDSYEETISPPTIKVPEDSLPESKISNESDKLDLNVIESIQQEAEDILDQEGYYVVKKNVQLKHIFSNIDSLALKFVRVNEHLDLLLIIPVKINRVKGSIIVSESVITLKTAPKFGSHSNILLKSYISHLIAGQETVFHDLISEGPLFQFLKKYLHMEIVVEKTMTSKRLYLRSGPLQYKIIIQPFLVNSEDVEISEKLIPYAYQKATNLYALTQSQLFSLLDFLERKYLLLERYSEKKNGIDRYFESLNSFIENIRLYSIPFMIFGVIFSFILLFHATEIFTTFLGLGYASVGIYISVFGYLYYKFYREKLQIQEEFRTPYYQQSHDLDETSLILISEELGDDHMTQFSYECLKNSNEFPLISQIEKKTTEKIIKDQIVEKKIEEKEYLEPIDTGKEKNSKLNKKSLSTISSFLEE